VVGIGGSSRRAYFSPIIEEKQAEGCEEKQIASQNTKKVRHEAL
jgi:hypothetical protein